MTSATLSKGKGSHAILLAEDELGACNHEDEGEEALDGCVIEAPTTEIGTTRAARDRGNHQDERKKTENASCCLGCQAAPRQS